MNRLGPRWIFHELRRRRVFNTVAIYIVGAWVALQVADLAFPGLEVPESAIRYVWMGAFLLFPLVLIFGWLYDFSTDGIGRTPSADAPADGDGPLRRLDHWLIGSLSIVAISVIGIMLMRISEVEPDIIHAPPENSIAVMPFEVCEHHAVDQKLANQLTTQVLNRLSERGMIKVIARNSSYSLAGFGWSIPRIARELGVEYVLSGEACRDGETLTMSAELRDKDDFIVQREHYSQVVNRFDQIELRIATQVADGVARELGDVTAMAPDTPVNRLAYEKYLVAQEYSWDGDYEQAFKAIEQALGHQPDLAMAMLLKAYILLKLPSDQTQAVKLQDNTHIGEEALELVNGQLEFGMSSGSLHHIAGVINHELGHSNEAWILSQPGELDQANVVSLKEVSTDRFQQAERHFRSSVALGYNEALVYLFLVDTLEHLGATRSNEVVEILERGLQSDPFDRYVNFKLAHILADQGRYREGIELLERFRNWPDVPRRISWQMENLSFNHAYLVETCELLIDSLLNEPERIEGSWTARPHWLKFFISTLSQLGLDEEAEAWLERFSNLPGGVDGNYLGWFRFLGGHHDEYLEAEQLRLGAMSDAEILNGSWAEESVWLLALAGEHERATVLMESIWLGLGFDGGAGVSGYGADDAFYPLFLAELYVKTNRVDDAMDLLEETARHLQREYDKGIRNPELLHYLAEAYAFLGQDNAALDMLEKAVDYHSRWPVIKEKTRIHSPWERLRDDPRFIRQWRRMETDLVQQAKSIRAILAQYDIDELLAPLMADLERPATTADQ